MPKIMDQYPRVESIGRIESIILDTLEVQVVLKVPETEAKEQRPAGGCGSKPTTAQRGRKTCQTAEPWFKLLKESRPGPERYVKSLPFGLFHPQRYVKSGVHFLHFWGPGSSPSGLYRVSYQIW